MINDALWLIILMKAFTNEYKNYKLDLQKHDWSLHCNFIYFYQICALGQNLTQAYGDYKDLKISSFLFACCLEAVRMLEIWPGVVSLMRKPAGKGCGNSSILWAIYRCQSKLDTGQYFMIQFKIYFHLNSQEIICP